MAWALFAANVFILPLLFGGAGEGAAALPEWFPTSPWALVAANVVAVALALPNTPFCLAAGAFLGLGWGIVIASLGSFFGSVAAFGVGRLVLRRLAQAVLGRFPAAARFVEAFGDADVRTLTLVRLSPLIPFAGQNFGWALTPVRFRTYVAGSLLATPVGASFFAHLGAAGRAGASMAADRFTWQALLVIVGLAATFFLVRRIERLAAAALVRRVPETPGAPGAPTSRSA